jgi:hypothetical protein
MITRSWTSEAANRLLLGLPPEEQAKIVEYGAMLRLADLRRQLAHAQSVIKEMQAKYNVTLADWERDGLPDDAGYAMHEDYIMWHHYTERAARAEKQIHALEEGMNPSERNTPDAG